MGATDPTQKMRNFIGGIQAYAGVLAQIPPGTMNMEEVGKEIFGRMGFKDGDRFLTNQKQDPEKMQMQQQMQQMGQMIQQMQQQLKDKSAEQQAKLMAANLKEQHEDQRTDKKLRAGLMETNLKEQHEDERTDKELRTKVVVERMGNVSQQRVHAGQQRANK
jgi:uncharacterized membrane protein YdfJ with MMPL/SSD domain